MGASLGNAVGGSKRRRSRRSGQLMSEINVTPFVDVMLVLLIVFMIAAPLLTAGVPIDLPETQARAVESQTEPIVISVTRDGQIFLQETPIIVDELSAKLVAISQQNFDTRIYVRGDQIADYGSVMKVMGEISSAGFKRIALLSEQEQN